MSLVSLRRLCKFLNSDVVEHTNFQVGPTISLDDATVTWPARKLEQGETAVREPFRLAGMTLKIPDEAKFILVCGATGAGKVCCDLCSAALSADTSSLLVPIPFEPFGRSEVAWRNHYRP